MNLNKLQRMGRRRFIENLAGIGVSTTTLSYLEQDDLSEITHDPEEEIPYIARWERVDENGPLGQNEVYKTIPRDEWERRETAIDVKDQVENKLGNTQANAYFTAMDDSETGFGVEVLLEENSQVSIRELENILPTEAKGSTPEENPAVRENIPIKIKETTSTESSTDSSSDCYVENNYDEVPGGQMIYATLENDDFESYGTMMAPFYSDDHSWGVITSGHVVEGLNIVGEHYWDKEPFADVKESKVDGFVDCGFAKQHSDQDTTYQITAPQNDGLAIQLVGTLSDEEIKNHVGDKNYEVAVQGRKSCRQYSHITGTGGESGVEAVALEDSLTTYDGDSGGPYFHQNPDNREEAYLIACHTGVINDGRPTGSTVETIQDELGGVF